MIRRSKATPVKPVDPKMVEIARLLRCVVRYRETAAFAYRMNDTQGGIDFTKRAAKAHTEAHALDPNEESPDWESVS